MLRTSLVRGAVAITLLAGLGAAGPSSPQPTQPSDKQKQLSADLAQAMSQIVDLKHENSRLQAQVRELQVKLALTSQLKINRTPSSVPENWQSKEFNGMTFYLVPLDAGSGSDLPTDALKLTTPALPNR